VSTVGVSGQVLRSPGQVQPAGDRGDRSGGESVVRLRNGAPVRVRPIRPADGPRLLALCDRLSPHTVYERFFSSRRLLPAEVHAFADVDYRQRMALVAEVDTGQESELIGVARYGPSDEETIADIGLVVADGWQGLGLGSIRLDEILRAGEQQGICRFSADVLTENRRALRLLARYTSITQRTTSDGVTRLVFHRRADGSLLSSVS
jgi:RimJ/RimL family protein N-acetyltransferase